MADHVLIVDDDPAILKLLEKVMRINNLVPTLVESGSEAIAAASSCQFDIILLDLTLGDMEGFDVIRTLRGKGDATPIIIISGLNEDYDMLYGLSLGADDYVTKPFRPQVLGAKVKAMIRRNRSALSAQQDMLACGPFVYNPATMTFFKNDEELFLSHKEGALLLLFMNHPRQVFTKEMIYEKVWGSSIAIDDNTIMVYINRLRSKIEDNSRNPHHIITVRGIGYRFIP